MVAGSRPTRQRGLAWLPAQAGRLASTVVECSGSNGRLQQYTVPKLRHRPGVRLRGRPAGTPDKRPVARAGTHLQDHLTVCVCVCVLIMAYNTRVGSNCPLW